MIFPVLLLKNSWTWHKINTSGAIQLRFFLYIRCMCIFLQRWYMVYFMVWVYNLTKRCTRMVYHIWYMVCLLWFPYLMISYCISMNREPENWPVVLFLVTGICFDSISRTSCCISSHSTPHVSWRTCIFLSYWCFSSSWVWRFATTGMTRVPVYIGLTKGVF